MQRKMRALYKCYDEDLMYLSDQRLVGAGQALAQALPVRVAAAGALPGLQVPHQPLETQPQLPQVLMGRAEPGRSGGPAARRHR